MYLNNAATTFPKPEAVTRAIMHTLAHAPAERGRGHGGQDIAERCRRRVAEFFGVAEPKRVCFAASGTDALNTALVGSLAPGDEVVSTAFDHNSVARPLLHLARDRGVVHRQVGLDEHGAIPTDRLQAAVSPRTRALVITHISNVTGAVALLDDAAELASSRGITLILDASQSAGLVPVDLSRLPSRTILAAAAHKGLYAPSGTGLLLVPDELVGQRVFGGTGVRSQDPLHPADLPHRHEAGTLNHLGIAGILAGLDFVLNEGMDRLARHRNLLVQTARERLGQMGDVFLSPLPDEDGRAGIVSFGLRGKASDEVGVILDSAFSIQVRTGLHCAPSAHRALQTFPDGLVRASFGAFNESQDVEALVDAVASIARA